jgi:hypothetical protein
VTSADAAVRLVFAFADLDRLIPTFLDLDGALAPAPAAAAAPRRTQPGMRTHAERLLTDPGAEPSPV